jgi:surface antigen
MCASALLHRASVRTLLVAIVAWTLALPIGARPALAASPPAPQDLASLDRELQQDQARLTELDNQVESTQGQLDNMNRKLAEDQARERDLRTKLANLARLQYERPVFGLATVLSARTLDQLLGEIAQSKLVARKQADMQAEAVKIQQRDQKLRDETAKKLDDVKVAQQQAAQVAEHALAARDQALKLLQESQARARADAQAQAAATQARAQAVMSQARAIAAPIISGPTSNHFPFGQCTWYVASRRDVPWYGNAIDWWQNSRPYGRPEGSAPRVGAIMVTRESGYGHVAYVESVNANGSWTVSEMNYSGWGQVDSRTIQPGFGYLVGFIY